MVLYVCRRKFFQSAFETANQLRLNKQLCDIELTVGTNTIHAHRIVLLTGSDYFRTLFLGPFSESSMSKVDLSSTTDDFQTVKCIVDFLYEGQIEINSENLADLMKMSSCFLVSQLQKFCTRFVRENLILSKALTFYFNARQYGFVELEKEIGETVKSRFHDYFVFQRETMNLSPDQIRHLFENKFMDVCTWNSILNFLSTWLDANHTPTQLHLSVAKSILEKVETEYISCGNAIDMHEAKHQYSDTIEALGLITTQLKSKRSAQGKQIVKLCQQLQQSLSSQKTADLLNQGLRKVVSRLSSDTHIQLQKSSVAEDVLVFIANRQCVIDMVDELLKSKFKFHKVKKLDTFTEPVFDICSYSPRTKEWRYLHSLNDVGIGNTLLNSSCYCPWEFVCIGDRLYSTAYKNAYEAPAYVLSMEDFSTVNVSEEDQDFESGEFQCEYTCLVGSSDRTVYSVSVDTEDYSESYIRIKKFTNFDNFNPNHSGDLAGTVFSIPKSERVFGHHYACLARSTNELLVAAGQEGIDAIVVVDLETELYRKYTTEDKTTIEDHYCTTVIEGEDTFYILEISKEERRPHRLKVHCRYQYVYGSQRLRTH